MPKTLKQIADTQATELLTTGKILVWDIETTDFKANFGHLLCWVAKFVGEEHYYYARIDDHPEYGKDPFSMMRDDWMTEQIVELIDSADAIVHHYGDKFDLPFVNTRALENGLLPPLPPTTIDTCKVARSGLKMTSNRLGVLAESFGGDCQKGGLSKEEWKLATHGHRPTMDRMLAYCLDDVLATEQVYLNLRPIIRNHPYIGPAVGSAIERQKQCPTCGSVNTHGHDTRRSKCFEIYRRRCLNCGSAFESGRRKIA